MILQIKMLFEIYALTQSAFPQINCNAIIKVYVVVFNFVQNSTKNFL